MARADIELARIYADRKSEEWINGAIDILVDNLAETDDVVNQYLAEEGYTMKVKSLGHRKEMIATLKAALDLKNGKTPFSGMSHMPSYRHRRTET